MADFASQVKESQAQVAEAQGKIAELTSRIEVARAKMKSGDDITIDIENATLEDVHLLGWNNLSYPKGKRGNLNLHAIQPAVLEVNALSDFTVTVVPEKTGRRVTGVPIGWGAKDSDGRKAAYVELRRARVGRKARITGTVEDVIL